MSTTRDSFRPPKALPKPNFRTTVDGFFRDFLAPVSNVGKSGYIQNSTLFDGTGWIPEKCLHSDLQRTEYRMRYNNQKPFHKLLTPITNGKLKKTVRVYDLEKKNING